MYSTLLLIVLNGLMLILTGVLTLTAVQVGDGPYIWAYGLPALTCLANIMFILEHRPDVRSMLKRVLR